MKNQKISSKIVHFLEMLALIVTISGISGLTIYQHWCGNDAEKSQKILDEKISEICDEISILNMQLQYYTSQEEYIIINGEGNKVDPATMLNYHPLIAKMEEIHKDYYFIDLITYMSFCGYDVEEKEIYLSEEWFFRMDYEQQAKILSNMFHEMNPYTYQVAKNYKYYADEIDYGDHIEYSNVTAEATDIEERSIPIFICTQIGTEPLGLIKITDENNNMMYPKINTNS